MKKSYIVVATRDEHEFIVTINQHLKEGYIPVGGICVVRVGMDNYYYQAMIK